MAYKKAQIKKGDISAQRLEELRTELKTLKTDATLAAKARVTAAKAHKKEVATLTTKHIKVVAKKDSELDKLKNSYTKLSKEKATLKKKFTDKTDALTACKSHISSLLKEVTLREMEIQQIRGKIKMFLKTSKWKLIWSSLEERIKQLS